MIILQKFSLVLKKTQSFFLKKRKVIEDKEYGNKGSFGGGGNGKKRNSKFFFNEDGDNFIYFGKILRVFTERLFILGI